VFEDTGCLFAFEEFNPCYPRKCTHTRGRSSRRVGVCQFAPLDRL